MRNDSAVLVVLLFSTTWSHSQEISQNDLIKISDARANIQMLDPVVITATRIPEPGFNLPLSIDHIDHQTIQHNGTAMINLSESLARVPGIVVQNRQNYAQDLQISSRGFGARSTFGVRGIRLYVDGIPATMPDGQGQTSHFDLSSADHIEVLRGPFSALYGNSSGGVISIFTEDGAPGFQLSPALRIGSFGMAQYGIKFSGEQPFLNYIFNITHFHIDGYRSHSTASRDTGNIKLRTRLGDDSSLTFIANAVSMPDTQDPLGLTRTQLESNRRDSDPNALIFNTRKSVKQQQIGLNYVKQINGGNSLHLMGYGGNRETIQYQSIPLSAQIAATSGGGVIDLSRQYSGLDLHWTLIPDSRHLQWTAGINIDNLHEDRRGYENFLNGLRGVKGRLRRDEDNNVYNLDQYLQLQWKPDAKWNFLAGIRNSNVYVESNDHYFSTGNGDDSGGTRYHSTTPAIGATFTLTDATNLYVSYGKGFETPTLNELSYRPAGAGFNLSLQPSNSNNLEAGIKALIGNGVRTNIAVFQIKTKNELAVLSNTGGRAVYQNAGKTNRNGLEFALEGKWRHGIGGFLSYSYLRASYADSFCSGTCAPNTQVQAGNRIPGIPAQTGYAELSWHTKNSNFLTALESKYTSKVYVDDMNSDAASRYLVINMRMRFQQKFNNWQMQEFFRIDNIANRSYIGSVIVNENNKRFFEPAPGRNYVAGVVVTYNWQ